MDLVADQSVHLVITSPPYWQLKDYGTEAQIGFHDNYENYINQLNLVWSECHRVLHPGCRLCVNIGDQFARSVYYGRYKVIPIRTEIIKFCEAIGFDYMGAIIWQKVTNTNTTGGASIMGSFPYPRNGILKLDYEFILIFKKQGKAPKPTEEQKQKSAMSSQEWNAYFAGHWNFGGAKQDGHIAVFPTEIPHRLIRMFSFWGETVLDPFLGSGTTSLAAQNLGRNSVGYEINPDFLPIIKEKLQVEKGEAVYEFLEEKPTGPLDAKIETLPYRFKDPHGMDKQTDPHRRTFGSRLGQERTEREEYFSVKEIFSANTLELDNGQMVRLLGVKAKPEDPAAAITFLAAKTKSQKIYLRFDKIRFDEENRLLCYVYLKNKTFLNAHLIKKKLAEVDESYDFKLLEKFKKLRADN